VTGTIRFQQGYSCRVSLHRKKTRFADQDSAGGFEFRNDSRVKRRDKVGDFETWRARPELNWRPPA
jgi:hypothetical protein